MSLYEPIFTDGGDTLYVMDQIRDKKNREENWVEHLSLSDALKKLNAREHEIISLRFFEGKTQMEVAELIGISQGTGFPARKKCSPHHARVFERMMQGACNTRCEYFTA